MAHRIRMLHKRYGDVAVEWETDTDTPEARAAIAEAERVFNEYVGKTHSAAVIDVHDRTKGEVIHEFKPEYEEIVMYPIAAGGT